ncbi:MAG: hypothetical protein VX641_03670 [Planctomycetota bacterium]|nr:hypothetical protein [Planctomycetota bacterium]
MISPLHTAAPVCRSVVRGWWCALIGVLVLVAARPAWSTERIDPVDGPHVEIKVKLTPEYLVMQVTMNIVFLDQAMTFERERYDLIDPSEGPALLEVLDDWAADALVARIDGVEVTPLVEGLMINDPDTSMMPLMRQTGMRGLRKVRFNLQWPVKSAPQEIELSWPSYPPDTTIDPDDPPPMQIAGEAAIEGIREAVFFTVDSPVWLWRSGSTAIEERLIAIPAPEPRTPWSIPVVSVALGGVALIIGLVLLVSSGLSTSLIGLLVLLLGAAGSLLLSRVLVLEFTPPGVARIEPPSTQQAEDLFVPLHGNIYRAFDYVEESDVYDALERSVTGDLLDELYRMIYASLVMEEAQGATSRVLAVRPVELEIGSIEVDAARSLVLFTALYRWQVDGRVAHWGHMHERTNEYLAQLGVVGSSEGWRIDSIDLLEQERIDPIVSEDEMPFTAPDSEEFPGDDFEF